MLRHKSDVIALFYMAVTTTAFFMHWQSPQFNAWLFAVQMLMATTVFVIAHNHNHVPMWRSKFLNRLTGYWITIFYGFPNFVWLPTHNLNHHKYNNTEGDDTLTYRFSEKNNLFTLLSYPSISGYFQQKPIYKYLWKIRKDRPKEFWYCISQYIVMAIVLIVAFALSWKKALLYLIVPQQFCTFSVLVINYIQHVHADEQSKYNHSRNFTGIANKFLLNNGLHTAHHEAMHLHWSQLPEAHAKLAPHIDPRLIEKSLVWYLVRVYVLGIFVPAFRTKSMRLERIQEDDLQATAG